jgi:hypothetical protein
VFGAFVGARRRPIDGGLIVVINCCTFKSVGHFKVLCSKADALQFGGAFICSYNFGLAGTESGLVLSYGFPCDWPPCPTNEITGHAAELV